jgi:hypothetical protein
MSTSSYPATRSTTSTSTGPSWNQNGLPTAVATSSIEQIDMVLSVYGMPACCAARQARISPRTSPVMATGASASGSGTGSPMRSSQSVAALPSDVGIGH